MDLTDPRDRNALHTLHDMIVIAVMAIVCGADSWVQVQFWGECKQKWLSTFLDLPTGIPSHDTFGRVFSLLDPDDRQDLGDYSGKISVERCYYISSLKTIGAKAMGRHIRGHWAVENNLHWQLDVSFNEDQNRTRKGHDAENYSRLNRIALNLIKREKTCKGSIKTRRLLAGWDHDYLLRLMQQ
ncbi:MAG TPA: ISAs1 family transposase [Tepidisphaeraceae bacterium]|nr:ISAs1 family transposase [Tepidisphaeraceae bacterium]